MDIHMEKFCQTGKNMEPTREKNAVLNTCKSYRNMWEINQSIFTAKGIMEPASMQYDYSSGTTGRYLLAI